MRLFNLIKNIIGRFEYINVIVDKSNNNDIPDGYSGGSLAADNILVITNSELPKEVVCEVFKKEEANYSILFLDDILCCNDIKKASKNLIGPFTHVINFFYEKDAGKLILNGNQYNDKDCVYQLYQWLQEEVDYLVKLSQYATINTVFISGSSIDSHVKIRNVEICIRGLAEALSNHGMICNGVIANQNVTIKELLSTSVFLSSRYGQVMTGEVLKYE